MSYTKKIKIRLEYYEIVCKKKRDGSDTFDRYFDLNLWIDKANNLSLEGRTFDYYHEQARLDKCRYDQNNNIWFLNFLRLRDTNIPSTAKVDQEAIPMTLDDDEFIGEDANALYDEKLNILMLQRNRHSLGVKGIEEYLNLVWKSDDEEIFLRPICPIDLQKKAKKAFEYRKISIRFADVNKNNLNTKEKKPFKKMFDSLKGFEGINAEITITMGYEKNKSLNKETVKDTINEIVENKDVITKANLAIKETDDSAVEVVDLFADKIHDFIFVKLKRKESLASEYVEKKMIDKFNQSKGELINALKVRNNE